MSPNVTLQRNSIKYDVEAALLEEIRILDKQVSKQCSDPYTILQIDIGKYNTF